MGTLDDLKNEAMKKAGEQMAERALEKVVGKAPEDETPEEAQKRKAALWLKVGGVAVVGVAGIWLLSAAIRWLFFLGVVGAVGYGGYRFFKPKLLAKQQERAQLRAAEQAAEQAAAAERAAVTKKEEAAQALEDDLERLKAQL